MTEENIYIVEGPVIPFGVKDADGNSPSKQEIKTLYANFENQQTDTMHSLLKNKGVVLIGNTILDHDKVIRGNTIKAGSWTATTRVTNPELIHHIEKENLTGYSLGTLPDFAKSLDYWINRDNRENDTNKRKTYDDIKDFKEAEPQMISFVDMPNHGLPFAYYSRDDFINKRKYFEDDEMSEKTENNNNDGVLGQLTAKLLDHVLINKETPTKEETGSSKEEEKTDENKYVTEKQLDEKFKEFKTEVVDEIKSEIKEIIKPSEENEGGDNLNDSSGNEDPMVNKDNPDKEKDDKKDEEPEEEEQASEKPEKTENPMIEKSFQERRAERRKTQKIIY